MSKILHFQLHLPPSSTLRPLSFSQTLTTTSTNTPLTHLTFHLQNLSLSKHTPSTLIRMGGGPRTYPGGVSKWQWKRMQAKKAKQLLKARLARERQIYEMRKRAELKAAVAELERPWEPVEKPPRLFSVAADEQLKVLADRFQRPGGFDLWTDKDGPQMFNTVDDVPSARFFPKGVVHSVKPYGRIGDGRSECEGEVDDTVSESGARTEVERRNNDDEGNRRESGRRVRRGGLDGGLSDSGIEISSGAHMALGRRHGGYERRKKGYGRRERENGVDMGLSGSGIESSSGTHMALGRRHYGGLSDSGIESSSTHMALGRRHGGYERRKKGYGKRERENGVDRGLSGSDSESDSWDGSSFMRNNDGKRSAGVGVMRKGNRRIGSRAEERSQDGFNRKMRGVENGLFDRRDNNRKGRSDRRRKMYDSDSQVYQMNLQKDGSYGL